MTNPFERDDIQYLVLCNDESQYSLWPRFAGLPAGWEEQFSGSREECLSYIEANWTDMRPSSLAEAMQAAK